MVWHRYADCGCINSIVYRSSPASPEDNEHTQIVLYDDMDVVKNEYDVMNTADNPQYGDTMKQSDATEPHENVYSYAIS